MSAAWMTENIKKNYQNVPLTLMGGYERVAKLAGHVL